MRGPVLVQLWIDYYLKHFLTNTPRSPKARSGTLVLISAFAALLRFACRLFMSLAGT